MIVEHMERHGTKFLREVVPTKFEKTEDGKVKVTYKNSSLGFEAESIFDTVVLAVGRDACTADLGLDLAGVKTVPGGKIPVEDEQTNVPHIYAIGDVLESRQELTPVAIKAGVRLARRLYGNGTLKMDYNEVPTTVFTPLEYGCVGLSEEAAAAKYGKDNIETYILYNTPLARKPPAVSRRRAVPRVYLCDVYASIRGRAARGCSSLPSFLWAHTSLVPLRSGRATTRRSTRGSSTARRTSATTRLALPPARAPAHAPALPSRRRRRLLPAGPARPGLSLCPRLSASSAAAPDDHSPGGEGARPGPPLRRPERGRGDPGVRRGDQDGRHEAGHRRHGGHPPDAGGELHNHGYHKEARARTGAL